MTCVTKGENTVPFGRKSKVFIENLICENATGVAFKLLLTYYLENGRVNQSISIE